MARESRLMLEVVVGPRTQESATELVEGGAKGSMSKKIGIILADFIS
jgi:hypothetical protein